MVPELFSTRCHVKNINVVEEGEGLINLFKRHILEVIIVSRDFIGESFTDNLLESVVLLSEHEDIVKSQLELVILDLIKDSFAFVVQSCSSRVKGCFKVFYLVHKEFEDVLDVFLFECELGVIQVHQSVALEDLKKLIIEVVDQSS